MIRTRVKTKGGIRISIKKKSRMQNRIKLLGILNTYQIINTKNEPTQGLQRHLVLIQTFKAELGRLFLIPLEQAVASKSIGTVTIYGRSKIDVHAGTFLWSSQPNPTFITESRLSTRNVRYGRHSTVVAGTPGSRTL